MRRLLAVLTISLATIALTSTAVNAAPVDPEPATTSQISHHVKKLTANLKFLEPATFKSDKADLQDPPGGGCDDSDVTGNLNYTYLDGVLATLEADWSAKVICFPTAPGQSLAQININSTLFHNGSNVAAGAPFACSNCNLGNSVGDWICGGVTCAGSYFVGAVDLLTLPVGWQWVTPGDGCTIQTNRRVMQCVPTTNAVTVPPTN